MNRANVFAGLVVGICFATAPAKLLAADGPVVRIGSKQFTESVILGEMLVHLTKEAGGQPKHLAEMGGTQVLWQALTTGALDVYPEYTGTIAEQLLRGAAVRDEAALREAVAKHGVVMTKPLGFANSYALGMKRSVAKQLGVTKISDLPKHPTLRLGLSDEFMERKDGWRPLKALYGLPFQDVKGLEHNLAYRGIAAGKFDLTDLYTTDAEIKFYDLVALEDDHGYFPRYNSVVLYRSALVEKHPEIAAALHKLEGKIDNAAMTEMNAQARPPDISQRITETQVAARFLRTSDLLHDPSAGAGESALRAFLRQTNEHLFLVAISLALAVLVGIPLGVAAEKSPALGQAVLGTVGVIQTIPSLALLVFLIGLFRTVGALPAIAALFLYSLLPIVRNTHAGLSSVPAALKESAVVLGLPPWARLWRIELPLASVSIASGIKTAAVINVGTATIGAFIGAGGYGQPIFTGIRLSDTMLMLQGAVPAAILALLVQGLFGLAERRLTPRGLRL